MNEPEIMIGPPKDMETKLSSFDECYSYSEIDTFQRCRRKHKNGYILRLGEMGAAKAADAGTVMHAAIATLMKTSDVDESVKVLRETWDRLFAWIDATGYELEKKYHREHLVELFLLYGLNVYRYEKLLPLSPDYVEVGFIIQIDDPAGHGPPASLYGRIDWIGKHEDTGHVAPADTKTASSFGEDFSVRHDPSFQGDTYYYTTKRLIPDVSVPGFYINGILMSSAKKKDPKELFNRILIARRGEIDMKEFVQEAYWWISEIRRSKAGNIWPKSTNQCSAFGQCGFRRLCVSHDNPNTMSLYPQRPPKGFHFSTEG